MLWTKIRILVVLFVSSTIFGVLELSSDTVVFLSQTSCLFFHRFAIGRFLSQFFAGLTGFFLCLIYFLFGIFRLHVYSKFIYYSTLLLPWQVLIPFLSVFLSFLPQGSLYLLRNIDNVKTLLKKHFTFFFHFFILVKQKFSGPGSRLRLRFCCSRFSFSSSLIRQKPRKSLDHDPQE